MIAETNDVLWTIFLFAVVGLATLPSTTIGGLVAVLKSASVGLYVAAGCLLCYLAYMLTPR